MHREEEAFQDEDGRTGGTKCSECDIWIKMPRKRRYPMPVWYTECEKCEIKDPFRRAMHKLNIEMSDEERSAVNKFKTDMWLLCEKFCDFSHLHDDPKISKLANDLMAMCRKIPCFIGKTKEEN